MTCEIAVVIGGLEGGGTQRVASHLVAAWIARGYHITLITLKGPEDDVFPIPEGARRMVIGGHGESGNALVGIVANLRRILRLRRAIRESGSPTVVSFLTNMNILTILATLGLRLRVVVSERSDPIHQDLNTIRRVMRRKLYRLATMVTANSQHAVDAMAGYVPRHKLAVVTNPVILPSKSASPDAEHTILMVGRLVAVKNHETVIKVFASLAKAVPDWRLVILGAGPLWDTLNMQIERDCVARQVQLMGHVSDPSAFYQRAAMLVMASSYEGSPNALLEAMAYGVPCVVSDSLPGVLAFVKDGVNGLVYRAGNVNDLRACLERLIADPQLRKTLGVAARKRIQDLSLDEVTKQWDGVIVPANVRRPSLVE